SGCRQRVVAIGRVVCVILVGALLASVVVNLAAYLRAAQHLRRHPPACPSDDERGPWPARLLAWLGAFGLECGPAVLLALGRPFWRERGVAARDAERPVILVHAYPLARRLRGDGFPVYCAKLLGKDFEARAAGLATTIDRIRRESGAVEVDLVAHGMAGLVAR